MIVPYSFHGFSDHEWTRHFFVADTQAELSASTAQPGEIGFSKDTGRVFVRNDAGVCRWTEE